jgi:hypothetical protein
MSAISRCRVGRSAAASQRDDRAWNDGLLPHRCVPRRLQYPDLRRKVASLAVKHGAETILIENAGGLSSIICLMTSSAVANSVSGMVRRERLGGFKVITNSLAKLLRNAGRVATTLNVVETTYSEYSVA